MTNKILRKLVRARRKHRNKTITTIRPSGSSSASLVFDFASLYPTTMSMTFGSNKRNILRRMKIKKILNG